MSCPRSRWRSCPAPRRRRRGAADDPGAVKPRAYQSVPRQRAERDGDGRAARAVGEGRGAAGAAEQPRPAAAGRDRGHRARRALARAGRSAAQRVGPLAARPAGHQPRGLRLPRRPSDRRPVQRASTRASICRSRSIDLVGAERRRAPPTLSLKAEKYGVTTARDLVVLVAVNLYLEAVATSSRVEMTRAQQDTAEALFKQAQDLKAAGLVAGIDVLRAQVQLQTQRQRVIAAENDFEKAKLQLARAIGLPLGQPFTLTDKIPYAPMPAPPLERGAGARARRTRPTTWRRRAGVDAARASSARRQRRAAAVAPRSTPTTARSARPSAPRTATYTIAATVRIPIFDGGRTTARRIEAGSLLRQREAELADLQRARRVRRPRGAARSARRGSAAAGGADQRAARRRGADAGARSLRRRRRQQPRSHAGAGSGRRRVGAVHRRALQPQPGQGVAGARARASRSRRSRIISEECSNGGGARSSGRAVAAVRR